MTTPIKDAGGEVGELLRAVKPRLRGWLHAGTFPVSVVAGIVLVVLAHGTAATVATGVYAASAALLFGISAIYHRGQWSPRARKFWRAFTSRSRPPSRIGSGNLARLRRLDREAPRAHAVCSVRRAQRARENGVLPE